MSVVVQECTGRKRVMLLTKGADAAVLPILSNEYMTSLRGEDEVFKVDSVSLCYLCAIMLTIRLFASDRYQVTD